MPEQRRFYAQVDGVRLHFLEFGSAGPNVLILPGITTPAILWRFVAIRMAVDAHVLILDNRGRGLSDQRPSLDYTLDAYARDAAGVIRQLGLQEPVVLGHSMGGRIGIRLAAWYPDLVDRLLLADPPLSGPGRRPYPSPLEQYLERLDAAAHGEPPLPLGRGTPETETQRRLRAEWLPTCSREAVVASHEGFASEDVFADLPRIRCPTLLLQAELGGTIEDAEAAEVAALLRNGRVQKLAGVGHLMPWFDLDAFLEAIRPFVHAAA